jgi:hypothetical protein
MKIPKSFNLFSQDISVSIKEKIDGDVLGECYLVDGYIHIAETYKGSSVNEKSMIGTFYHEKVHLILDAMGYHKLSGNEFFVETFAQLLLQSDLTAKY